jgi:mercuric ion transport protein
MKRYFLLGLAMVTCPCHLPLLLVVLAGTGLAGVLSQHFGAAFLILSAIFVTSLLSGLKALKKERVEEGAMAKKVIVYSQPG